MSLNLNSALLDTTWVPEAAKSDVLSVLTDIYKPETNIAIWQRPQNPILEHYAAQWLNAHPTHSIQSMLLVNTAADHLNKSLPELDGKNDFQSEVSRLIDMYACLFDADTIGLRITPLTTAMCPRFHVDKIACRLVVTYAGTGTEWLPESNVDRLRLGRGAKGFADHESGIFHEQQHIQQVDTQAVALLKGSAWEGNESYGLVHRSPQLPSGQTRLLLTLDGA